MRRLLLGIGLAASVAACSTLVDADRPLTIGFTVDKPTLTLGDSMLFTITVQGTSLVGVTLDYGDGSTTAYPTSGAQTARLTYYHTYKARGSYDVVLNVTDARAGERGATIQVRVN